MGSLIISRACLLLLVASCVTSLTPLSAAGDDNDCALYLSGPGRTSAYDYSLNLLKGNFGYEGQHTCITYDAVNQAYLEARNRIVVSQPKGEWKAEDYASVGELILDISINLARRYGLTYEEIEKGLPLIDTSRTLIRDVCPPVFSHVECRAGKYRRLDGLCNNLEHPTWGATMAPFQRLIGPLFADGINAPRIAHTGRDLPLSRVVSRTMHPDEGFHDHAGTVMVIAWGQFMDHDYTLTGTPLDPINRNDPEECCKRPPHLKHPYCNEIRIPDDDYFYRLWGVKCIDFVRAFPSPRPGCRLGSRVPFNTLTGVLDGNTVYGVTDKFARKLRTGYGGLLRMNPVFKEYGLKDLLPLKLDIPDEGCTRPNKNMFCFEAGEIRASEQLVLTVMHTLMAREHNRVAEGLAQVNPHWDDETLYQEARRINIAEIQHITYNEFLPILLGKDVMEKFGLVLEKEGYWDGYDPTVNPDVIDSFAAAAYRFGHSLLPTAVERWSKAHKFIASKRLSDLIRRPFDLYRAGVLDEYVMGLMNQVAQAMDDSITQEVTNHLFKKVGARFGMDLVSFNMQRGREFGVPGYMEFRKFCGLAGADSFQDLFGSMPNETVRKYETIFEHPIDVDLWSGGVSERPLPGSMLGPTFACIIATQFSYSRRGDRFWYELPNQPSSFTPEQLAEVRKARLARVICDTTDIIDTVQLYPMVLPDHELNPRVPCRSGIIPSIDFSKWAEPAPFHSGPKPFMTEAFIDINNKTENETHQVQKKTESFDATIIANNNKTATEATKTENNTTQLTKCNDKCAEKVNNCTDCHIKLKEAHGSDTILKYVYKRGDKIEDTSKYKGDSMNSLKRKRRSNLNFAASAPLIVNYETSHSTAVGQPSARNVIQGASLADFNIETSHGAQLDKSIDKIKHKAKKFDSPSSIEDYDHKRGEITNHKEIENSKERSEYSDNDRKHDNRDKAYNHDRNKYIEAEKDRDDSKSTEVYHNRDHSKEIDDSEESTVHNSEESYEKSEINSPYKQKDHGKENINYTERASDESKEKYSSIKRTTPYKEHDERKERTRDNDYRSGESDESSELGEPKKSSAPYIENENSEENNDYKEKSPDRSQEIYDDRRYRERDSNESKEKYETSTRLYSESKEKDEYNEKVRHQNSPENYDSREKEYSHSDKLSSDSDPKKDSSESREQNDEDTFYNRPDSREKYNEQDGRSAYTKSSNENSESSEQENYHAVDNVKPNNVKSNQGTFTDVNDDSEEEAIIAIMKKKKKKPSTEVRNAYDEKSAPIIKDVDLADFTYETIHVNDKGKVEPVKDDAEFYTNPPFIAPLTTSRPNISQGKNEQLTRATPREEISLNYDSNEDSKEHKPIDDLEVKPVVEINPEKGESDEENSKEAIKTISNEDTSLETFLGIKDVNSDEKSDKIVAAKENPEEENGNVKQQFERIPLNYNLAKKQEQEQNRADSAPSTSTPSDPAGDLHNNIKGTLDIITPRYDEQLNIKFDDVSIKLPEIKLPQDILNIPHDDYIPPYKQREEKAQEPIKEKFFHYDENEYNAHESHGPKHKQIYNHEDIQDHDDPDDHVYHYGNYGKNKKKKDDYKKKETHADDEEADDEEADDEEEDLYEKFVRERFGKKGSFEKRSEKLRSIPSIDNEKLFKSLQLVLNKAQNIEKEAKKSGDPNAGYLWTVEYGQQL